MIKTSYRVPERYPTLQKAHATTKDWEQLHLLATSISDSSPGSANHEQTVYYTNEVGKNAHAVYILANGKSYIYDTQSVLGQGNFGSVAVGWCVNSQKFCAIKTIKSVKPDSFVNEIHALKRVEEYYGHYFDKEHHIGYIVFQYHFGTTLKQFIDEHPKSPIQEKLPIAKMVVDALHVLHTKYQVIHCDLKLENIIYDASIRSIKLCDFGSSVHALSRNTYSFGTPYYTAPELITDTKGNRAPNTIASDIYAIAIVLVYLISERTIKDINIFVLISLKLWAKNTLLLCDEYSQEELFAIRKGFRPYFQELLRLDSYPPLNKETQNRAYSVLLTMMDQNPCHRPPLDNISAQLLEIHSSIASTHAKSPDLEAPELDIVYTGAEKNSGDSHLEVTTAGFLLPNTVEETSTSLPPDELPPLHTRGTAISSRRTDSHGNEKRTAIGSILPIRNPYSDGALGLPSEATRPSSMGFFSKTGSGGIGASNAPSKQPNIKMAGEDKGEASVALEPSFFKKSTELDPQVAHTEYTTQNNESPIDKSCCVLL